jgi:hypothetical protein
VLVPAEEEARGAAEADARGARLRVREERREPAHRPGRVLVRDVVRELLHAQRARGPRARVLRVPAEEEVRNGVQERGVRVDGERLGPVSASGRRSV